MGDLHRKLKIFLLLVPAVCVFCGLSGRPNLWAKEASAKQFCENSLAELGSSSYAHILGEFEPPDEHRIASLVVKTFDKQLNSKIKQLKLNGESRKVTTEVINDSRIGLINGIRDAISNLKKLPGVDGFEGKTNQQRKDRRKEARRKIIEDPARKSIQKNETLKSLSKERRQKKQREYSKRYAQKKAEQQKAKATSKERSSKTPLIERPADDSSEQVVKLSSDLFTLTDYSEEEVWLGSLWFNYRFIGSERAKEELFEFYQKNLIEKIAYRLLRRWGISDPSLHEALITAGLLGLSQAMDRFVIYREAKFTTYASHRISGAMIDWMRDDAPFTRGQYKKLGDYLKAENKILRETGMEPFQEEVFAVLELSPQQIKEMKALLAKRNSLSLSRDVRDGETMELQLTDILRSSEPPPDRQAETDDLFARLTSYLHNETQREVFTRIYKDNRTHAQIGAELDLTGSRITQINKEVLQILRSKMSYEDF